MKPAPFGYAAAASVDEAVEMLAATPEAVVLAGGQSLLIEMRYRQRRPPLLVDVGRIGELTGWSASDDEVRFGALVRHVELERLEWSDPLGELFRRVAPFVAHPPIRNRGTLGGSLAWAHPAAEWCALAAVLDATVHVRGPSGDRSVAAGDWFRGRHETALGAGELLTAVSFPRLGGRAEQRAGGPTGVGWAEHRRTHGSFAMAAAVVTVTRSASGAVESARVGLANAADVPVRSRAAEAVLVGSDSADIEPLARAVGEAAAGDADPIDEPHCSPEYRRHALAVLTARACREALA